MGICNTRPEKSDPDSMSHRESEEWRKAEALRNAEIFGRAGRAFKDFWDQTGDPEAGWRYASCMRKSGYLETALGLLNDLAEYYPDHPEIREERVWTLYQARMVPAKDKGNTQEIIEAARELVAAEAEGVQLKLAVFAVLSAAKTKGHWKLVSAWCDLLSPETLDNRAKAAGKGTIPSDRERWYFAKLKALINLEEWHLAASVAETACQEFPDNKNFLRWKANSWAGMGLPGDAIALLDTLRPRIPWYALADMARYHLELEEVEASWERAVEAAIAVGQDSAKVNLWELMARLSLANAQIASAEDHVGLMQAIRNEESWPLRPSHQQLIDTVLAEQSKHELAKRSSREWKKRCRTHWGEIPESAAPARPSESNLKQATGTITGLDQERTFAFIQPDGGGEQVFVLVKDLPGPAQQNGHRVEFRTIKHYDKRKNRESTRAVQVQPLC